MIAQLVVILCGFVACMPKTHCQVAGEEKQSQLFYSNQSCSMFLRKHDGKGGELRVIVKLVLVHQAIKVENVPCVYCPNATVPWAYEREIDSYSRLLVSLVDYWGPLARVPSVFICRVRF